MTVETPGTVSQRHVAKPHLGHVTETVLPSKDCLVTTQGRHSSVKRQPTKKKIFSGVPPAVRAFVVRRDEYRCVAPMLDGRAGWCRDIWGNPITRWPDRDPGPVYLQMSHTKDPDELMLGKKACSDPDHLVSLCPFHHTGTQAGSNWEAANRDRIRNHLIEVNPPRRVR